MTSSDRAKSPGSTFITLSAGSAFLAVALGAFGAHGLRGYLTEANRAIYHTAVDYQMWHSLALGLIGILMDRLPGEHRLRWSAWSMLSGILLFSGSLYLLSLTDLRWLGMITPLGGLSFLLGWLWLAVASWRKA